MMTTSTASRFMALPTELRHRTYDFVGLVHDEPLSIYEISKLPQVILDAPEPMQVEMLNVYLEKNRFCISSLMGLQQLLDTDAKPYVSCVRHLRLAARGTWKDRPFWHKCDCKNRPRCVVDIALVKREPWFTIQLTYAGCEDESSTDKVLASMEVKLDAILSASNDDFPSFDSDSLCNLAVHWMRCRPLLENDAWSSQTSK